MSSALARYTSLTPDKTQGVTYTPKVLADFVAEKIVSAANIQDTSTPLRVLDPAVGDGELLLSLLEVVAMRSRRDVVVYGFDTDPAALAMAQRRITEGFPKVRLRLACDNFLNVVAAYTADDALPTSFGEGDARRFDLIIANPPYVRTQIIGADRAKKLAMSFKLTGRIDLYHAFLIGIGWALKPGGTTGIIVSNRFMTTRGGASVRAALRHRFVLRHIFDLGDTKLFDAAVLPVVILADGRNGTARSSTAFTSIYQTSEPAIASARNAIDALGFPGTVELSDLRRFRVEHGTLDDTGPANGIWRIATGASDAWLASVMAHRWGTFGDIGKIRVGVKTCADKVFIRTDWDELDTRPELLRPLTTHHIARRFRPFDAVRPSEILYPHENIDGQRRSVELSKYPRAQEYLESHRSILEARGYVINAGRHWYELWVPQDPASWAAPKLVFRDICERPTFWLDLHGTIVNGDCYWLTPGRPGDEPLLWLAAAVANSTFAEAFYDRRFNNKLYSSRRRFITQYVQEFPLPDPSTRLSKEIEAISREIYAAAGSAQAAERELQLDGMIWEAFGLVKERPPERTLDRVSKYDGATVRGLGGGASIILTVE